jgi:hypothetical protein
MLKTIIKEIVKKHQDIGLDTHKLIWAVWRKEGKIKREGMNEYLTWQAFMKSCTKVETILKVREEVLKELGICVCQKNSIED